MLATKQAASDPAVGDASAVNTGSQRRVQG